MILGTVQLGVPYGVNNQTGMPDSAACRDILSLAQAMGVRMLDTASGYGESETRIGEYLSAHPGAFEIATKLPVKFDGEKSEQGDALRAALAKSAQRLCVKKIDLCYLHRFEQFVDDGIMGAMSAAKEAGLVDRIGVSVYEPSELLSIATSSWEVDVVQIPLNVFTLSSWGACAREAVSKGISLYARSVYLQGLVFSDPDGGFACKVGGTVHLRRVQELAERKKCSVAAFCLGCVRAQEYIADVLLGCETLEQLTQNVELERTLPSFTKDELDAIEICFHDLPETFTNPSLWPRDKEPS